MSPRNGFHAAPTVRPSSALRSRRPYDAVALSQAKRDLEIAQAADLAAEEDKLATPGSTTSVGRSVHDGAVDALELIVDEGRPANAGRFFQLGHDLLALLDELSDVPVAWRITSLRTGSALATVPRRRTTRTKRACSGSRTPHSTPCRAGGGLSDDWSPDAVRVAHRFVEHGQRAEGETDWVPPRLRLVRDNGPACADRGPDARVGRAAWTTCSRSSAGCPAQSAANSSA